MKFPKQDAASMNKFYGNPDANRDGVCDPTWQRDNLIKIVPPYKMQWSWGGDVKALWFHKKAADSLLTCLDQVAKLYGSQAAIEKARMHLCGGTFNFRLKRGGSTLSIHSWGAAIDLDPVNNGLGVPWPRRATMPLKVVEVFERNGWTAGARWRTSDAMHFQAASL